MAENIFTQKHRAVYLCQSRSYDNHADLLYELTGQMVAHLKSYLKDAGEVANVLQYYHRQLADFIHAQMQQHHWEKVTGHDVVVSKGFSTLKPLAFTAPADEPIHNFRSPVADKTKIAQMIFGGFKKCLYPVQKFQSDTERVLSVILDREGEKWFKPGRGQFQIFYKWVADQREPQVVGKRIVTSTPGTWPRCDREAFWEDLFHAADKLVDKFIPKSESEDSVILSVNTQLKVPANRWHPENRSAAIKQIADANSLAGELVGISVQPTGRSLENKTDDTCPVCGWIHDLAFTQIKIGNGEAISLGGILPDIVRLVHDAHRKGLNGLNTKDDALFKMCGGYKNPCKAFDDLNRRKEYKYLFDTRRRGFISLRGVVGRNRNKSEANPE